MRKIKKIIMSLVLIGVMVIGMCGTVSAKTTTGVWNSPKTTAGSWWSGYDNDDITSLTGTSSSIYGGDVGVYFMLQVLVCLMVLYVHLIVRVKLN